MLPALTHRHLAVLAVIALIAPALVSLLPPWQAGQAMCGAGVSSWQGQSRSSRGGVRQEIVRQRGKRGQFVGMYAGMWVEGQSVCS
jgi:hypothetical protein